MIHYREGYLYQASRKEALATGIIPPHIISQEFFTLCEDGTLIIESGYAWDGATLCPEWVVPRRAPAHTMLFAK